MCNMASECVFMPEDKRPSVIVPMYNGKEKEQNAAIIEVLACLSVVGKIYAGILVDRVRKVTEA